MTTVIVSHNVGDFTTWKQAYDGNQHLRAQHGCLSAEVLRGAQDANQISVVMQWPSAAQAQAFLGDPGLKAAMAEGGVVGTPDIRILDSVEVVTSEAVA